MVNTRVMGEKIFAPSILFAEACAAISRITGDTTEAQAVLSRLRNSSVITLIPVTTTLAVRAAEIGLQHKIRGCDAIYVAVA
ncbi:MAG: PIN domain-containing protein [Chloroflexota bacterium]